MDASIFSRYKSMVMPPEGSVLRVIVNARITTV